MFLTSRDPAGAFLRTRGAAFSATDDEDFATEDEDFATEEDDGFFAEEETARGESVFKSFAVVSTVYFLENALPKISTYAFRRVCILATRW